MDGTIKKEEMYKLTGQLSAVGVPNILKILHAKPISPLSPLNRLSLVHCAPRLLLRFFGTMNGVGVTSSGSRSLSISPSSSSLHRRRAVKNCAKVAPRLQRSIARGSYVRVPNKSSGAL